MTTVLCAATDAGFDRLGRALADYAWRSIDDPVAGFVRAMAAGVGVGFAHSVVRSALACERSVAFAAVTPVEPYVWV